MHSEQQALENDPARVQFLKELVEQDDRKLGKLMDKHMTVCLFCEFFNKELISCSKDDSFIPLKLTESDANCPVNKW
jgi:hypothetical protein